MERNVFCVYLINKVDSGSRHWRSHTGVDIVVYAIVILQAVCQGKKKNKLFTILSVRVKKEKRL